MREFRIRDHHEANKIRPYWCPGPLNVADFFSKTLQKNLFNINLKRLGMVGSFRDEVESRALTAYGHSLSDWVNAPSAGSWRLYHRGEPKVKVSSLFKGSLRCHGKCSRA